MANTRRSFLQTLAVLPAAGLPAALGSPAAALADAPEAHPDADLIAFAARVEALAVRSDAVLLRRCNLEDRAQKLSEPEPIKPPDPSKYVSSFEDGPDGSFTLRNVRRAPDPAVELALERHAEAVEAWEAERESIERRIGFRAADRLHNRLYERLRIATCELTPMEPTTMAGLVAKARVARALDPKDEYSLNDWEAELKTAILHDVVRIGGAA